MDRGAGARLDGGRAIGITGPAELAGPHHPKISWDTRHAQQHPLTRAAKDTLLTAPAGSPLLLDAAVPERLVDYLVHIFSDLIDAEARRPLARRVFLERLEQGSGVKDQLTVQVGVLATRLPPLGMGRRLGSVNDRAAVG